MNMDPAAEISRRYSPYAYALDNPVFFIDPDGMVASPSDIYLDAKTGEVLGTDKDGNNGVVRVINRGDWNDANEVEGGVTSDAGTAEAREWSSVVTVNESQIQTDIDAANNETIADQTKERQVYIGLSVNRDDIVPTAEVTSVRGPDGVDGETTVSTSTRALEKDSNGNVTRSKTTFTDTKLLALAQVHTHNKTQKTGHKNIPGTSTKDKNTSNSKGFPIFAIDSYTGTTTGGNAIHRVNPDGTQTNNVSTTSTQNIGLDALKFKVGL